MSDTNSAVGGVDGLATRTRGTEGINTEICLINSDFNIFSLGEYGNGRGRGMDTTGLFCFWNALNTMEIGRASCRERVSSPV